MPCYVSLRQVRLLTSNPVSPLERGTEAPLSSHLASRGALFVHISRDYFVFRPVQYIGTRQYFSDAVSLPPAARDSIVPTLAMTARREREREKGPLEGFF